MTDRRAGDAGVSLIEVLVSLAIFAIIGVAGLAILNTVARTGERTEGRLERLAEIDRAFLVIRRDLAQIAPGAVTLNDGGLSFRRARGDGTVAMAYRMKDTVLTRQIDNAVTGAIDQNLLSGTESAQWRMMDRSRGWHTVWPPPNGADGVRPFAAELTIEVWRAEANAPDVVTRLVALPAGQGK